MGAREEAEYGGEGERWRIWAEGGGGFVTPTGHNAGRGEETDIRGRGGRGRGRDHELRNRLDEHAGDAGRLAGREEAEDQGRRGDGRDDLGPRRSETRENTDLDTERSEVGEASKGIADGERRVWEVSEQEERAWQGQERTRR